MRLEALPADSKGAGSSVPDAAECSCRPTWDRHAFLSRFELFKLGARETMKVSSAV
jgi:hypothetical protein